MRQICLDCHLVLMKLFKNIKKQKRKHLAVLGLTPGHLHVLRQIKQKEALTLSELSKRAGMENSNVTSVIDSFVEKGFVQRQRDSMDRRIVRVSLSEQGEEFRNRAVEQHDRFISDLYGNLTEEEMNKLIKIAKQVTAKISGENEGETD